MPPVARNNDGPMPSARQQWTDSSVQDKASSTGVNTRLWPRETRATANEPSKRRYYRYFGGGGRGFGTPVVSYAPRPMLIDESSLVIIETCVWS
jgi:hypothetical protein